MLFQDLQHGASNVVVRSPFGFGPANVELAAPHVTSAAAPFNKFEARIAKC